MSDEAQPDPARPSPARRWFRLAEEDFAAACPPEDCGGSGGYAELLEVLADPAHGDRDDLMEWVGEPFDPTSFDLVAVNVALQHVR